jgi:GNAT superfamily N-acetyltransferase
LECIAPDATGRLIRIPGPDPDDIARVYAFQYAGGHRLYLRHDVPDATRERIEALGAERVHHDLSRVRAILAHDQPCNEVWSGQTYLFAERIDSALYPDAVRLTDAHRALLRPDRADLDLEGRAMYAVIQDDQIVSTCQSVRRSDRAGEAYVYTDPAYRRRGYGRQVTAAWASHLHRENKTPFYSHAQDNDASRGVARSLGLIPCFACVNYA